MRKVEIVNNKIDVVKRLMGTTKGPVSHADIQRIVEGTFNEIKELVANGETVIISQFGKFEARDRAARTGRNPHTGEEMIIPAKKVPAFKPSTVFKDKVNQ